MDDYTGWRRNAYTYQDAAVNGLSADYEYGVLTEKEYDVFDVSGAAVLPEHAAFGRFTESEWDCGSNTTGSVGFCARGAKIREYRNCS